MTSSPENKIAAVAVTAKVKTTAAMNLSAHQRGQLAHLRSILKSDSSQIIGASSFLAPEAKNYLNSTDDLEHEDRHAREVLDKYMRLMLEEEAGTSHVSADRLIGRAATKAPGQITDIRTAVRVTSSIPAAGKRKPAPLTSPKLYKKLPAAKQQKRPHVPSTSTAQQQYTARRPISTIGNKHAQSMQAHAAPTAANSAIGKDDDAEDPPNTVELEKNIAETTTRMRHARQVFEQARQTYGTKKRDFERLVAVYKGLSELDPNRHLLQKQINMLVPALAASKSEKEAAERTNTAINLQAIEAKAAKDKWVAHHRRAGNIKRTFQHMDDIKP